MGNFRFSNEGVCYLDVTPKKNWILDTKGETFIRCKCRFIITLG